MCIIAHFLLIFYFFIFVMGILYMSKCLINGLVIKKIHQNNVYFAMFEVAIYVFLVKKVKGGRFEI
jgi:hypothetical protein